MKEWVDTNLRWNPLNYGNVQDLRIHPDKVWRPDVLMYNRYEKESINGFDPFKQTTSDYIENLHK